MLLLKTQQSISEDLLHIEFQTRPEVNIPFRMLDYWVRTRRRYPTRKIRQVVIYLRRSQAALVHQTYFQEDNTSHQFEVVRLWEQPFEAFLASPGLLPFDILSRVEDPVAALEQVAIQIRTTLDLQTQKSIGASTAVLAGLLLEKSLIERIVGMDLLADSTVYQGLVQEGIQKGVQQELRAMVLRLLNRKLGEVPSSLKSRASRLSIERTRALNEAILDFQSVADLEVWLNSAETRASEE